MTQHPIVIFDVISYVLDRSLQNICETIDFHWIYLSNKICNIQYLLELLYLDEAISFAEMESITACKTFQSQVGKLLNIIKDKSGTTSQCFNTFLDEIGRAHV